MQATYPTFDICNLVTNRISHDLINVDRFYGYTKNNPHLQKVHKHSFYHLVLFTAGEGQHILDFESYPIERGTIYFMRPNQVHKWILDGEVDGYVVNFSPTFFDQLMIGSAILDNFPFFNLFSSNQVLSLDRDSLHRICGYFEEILKEFNQQEVNKQTMIMISSYLLQIFVSANRNSVSTSTHHNRSTYNTVLLRKFMELIEEHFREVRLPKDYASMLYISSSHLNFICQELTKTSAGDLIRKRVLLEAKRLLVNFEMSISAIALDLNFFDTSYFVKFFKKHTGSTPDSFRKQYYYKPSL